MIADDVIERVRLAADIVQIVGEYVPLRRLGGSYRGPCPFHQGTKPNFSVTPEKGTYHCFVCHESGDVFTFVRKRLGLDWVGAVKLVGERVGIEVIDQPTRAHAPDPNERNWEVLATAAEWFRVQLEHESMGVAARTYLDGRAIDAPARARFGVGFAPRDGQLLRRYLHSLGFDDARQLEAGVLFTREGESEARPRFRERIMFPIVDELGHHVAFGGRAMGDHAPKYLNSGESTVFQKRRTLYGLHAGKQAIRRAGRAIVVEGYLDAIRVALAGIEEVVAPLGTALTEEQAALIVRYAGEVFLLYDSDEAGQKATFRSGLELLRHKAAVRVVSLPNGEDPDTFVRAHGRAALETQLSQAIDLFDRQIQILERRGWFANLRHQRRAIDSLLPTIRAARDPLTRDMYLTRLADVSGVDKATIASEADEPPATARGGVMRRSTEMEPPPLTRDDAAPPPGEYAPSAPAPFVKRPWVPGRRGKPAPPEWHVTSALPRARRDDPVERALVRAMLADRDVVERIAERHAPTDFRDANYRELFSVLLAAGHRDDVEEVGAALSPEAFQVFRELMETGDAHPPESVDLSLVLNQFRKRPLEARIREIMDLMPTRSASEQIELLNEIKRLKTEIAADA
jgi:DNA primase